MPDGGMKRACERGDLNPHGVTHQILSLARLPIPPLSRTLNKNGEPCRDRTYDPLIKSQLLYQLS